ncbi:MAG: sigma-70 family RNA polymerase sigma factor, partial [Planctomycetes bacterium]|nr:sigma-70 family RNA polymerase sigma factor [Planctomycetota bacterium]
ERGYESIVTRYAPLVYHRCRRALGAADADDATQAVFLILARKRDQATASPVLAAWLLTVANHVVCNALRDRERRRRAERSLPPPPPTPDREPMDGFKDHLDASLAELPAAERDAITLHHLAGHSLAEVARLTGAGLSTVKDRIQRGLDRLRRSLATRGVALGATALLACLTAEGQAAVPGEVLGHLRDLAPAGDGAGATGGPTPRALRWSRQRTSSMTRIALGGAALLLVAGALTTTYWSAEAGLYPRVPRLPVLEAGAPLPGNTPPTPPTLVPERARTWYLLRVNDGRRLSARMLSLPEMAFLSQGEKERAISKVATVHEAALLIDEWAFGNHEDIVSRYRNQLEDETLPPSERLALARECLPGFHMTVGNKLVEFEFGRRAGRSKRQPSEKPQFLCPPLLGALRGWVDNTGPEAMVFATLRALTATEPGPIADNRLSLASMPDGWEVRSPSLGSARLMQKATRLIVGSDVADPGLTAMLLQLRQPQHQEADLEFRIILDTGIPGSPQRPEFDLQFTVTPNGLRMSAQIPKWDTEAEKLDTPCPNIEAGRFASIPGRALIAGGVALNPLTTSKSSFWNGLVKPLLQVDKAAKRPGGIWFHAICSALENANGNLVAWVETGSPLPVAIVELDLPRSAHDHFIAALAADQGMAEPSDGTLSFFAGPVSIAIAWRDGRSVFTTNPAGVDAIDRSGGFLDQPEIVRALAELPQGPYSACALLWSSALVNVIKPVASLYDPQLTPRISDYALMLEQKKGYGFMAVGSGTSNTRIETAGVQTLFVCAILAGLAQEYVEKLNGIN